MEKRSSRGQSSIYVEKAINPERLPDRVSNSTVSWRGFIRQTTALRHRHRRLGKLEGPQHHQSRHCTLAPARSGVWGTFARSARRPSRAAWRRLEPFSRDRLTVATRWKLRSEEHTSELQ